MTPKTVLYGLQHCKMYRMIFAAYCSEAIPAQPVQATTVTLQTLDQPGQQGGVVLSAQYTVSNTSSHLHLQPGL